MLDWVTTKQLLRVAKIFNENGLEVYHFALIQLDATYNLFNVVSIIQSEQKDFTLNHLVWRFALVSMVISHRLRSSVQPRW